MFKAREERKETGRLSGEDITSKGFVKLNDGKFYGEVAPVTGVSKHRIWIRRDVENHNIWNISENYLFYGRSNAKTLYTGNIRSGDKMMEIISRTKYKGIRDTENRTNGLP